MTQTHLDPTLASAQLRAALERAEGALRESQRQYREIFELASVGIFQSTPEGRILLANPALAKMLGYASTDDLRELDLARDIYLRAEDRTALIARYGHSAEPWTVEIEWRKRDATPLWVQLTAHLVLNAAGQPQYFEAFVQDVTERRRSVDALRLSEARYRALATNLPDTSVFLYDHDLRYVLVDGSSLAGVGMSKEGLEGRTIFDVLPPEQSAGLAPLRRAALAGEVVEFEYTYSGHTHAVHLLPIRDDTGAVLYGMGVAVDITERKRDAERLAENEGRLRAIVDAEPECVKVIDANGRVVTMNPAGLAMLEADTPEQIVGQSALCFVVPEYQESFVDLSRRVLAGETGTLEFEIVGFKGTRRWLETHAVPMLTPRGEIQSMLGITRDITKRKEAEQALRASEERLQLVTRATNDAVWDWDLATDALWWGEAFHVLFGYGAHEIEPSFEAWHSRLHPEDRDRVMTGIRAAIDGGEVFWSDEYRFQRKDGVYAEIYDRGYVIHDADRRPVRMVGSMMEISERKRTEAQLRNLAARLEAIREEERTRIAREIHDEVGQALTALKMDLAWLAKKVPARGTPVRRKLVGMESVIDATMDALHRILAELRPGVLDDLGLPAAIRWLAEEFKRRTEIACTVQMTGGEPGLDSGQATAVFRILQEALTNVVRHAKARHVEIRLHVLPTAFELVVTDDGRGITPAELQATGTLGILGMRERAITWHGRVTVHGEPGHGTTVRVFMPVDRAAPPGGARRMIRLLIADDHPLVRAGVHQLVGEERDIQVVGEAVDGNDLLARLPHTPADVVILDVTMPGPGFLPLLARLKNDHPAVRVLVVSVHPEGNMALGALQGGAAGYVNKTRTGAELVAAIRKVHAGGTYVTPSLAERIAAELTAGHVPRPRDGLSEREHEVLRLLGAGKSNKEVAAMAGVSPKTISTYRARILRKLRLRTNADLVRYALEHALIG